MRERGQRGRLPRLFWISPGKGVGPGLLARLSACVQAGLRGFQCREKGASARELRDFLPAVRDLLRPRGGLCLVNDRIDVARVAGADGVQLGGGSLGVREARSLLGSGAWIGVSVHDAEECARAEEEGADFLLLSPVFRVRKPSARPPLGIRAFERLAARAEIPVFALGGVRPEHCRTLLEAGARGVAVLSGIGEAEDPGEATAAYLEALG